MWVIGALYVMLPGIVIAFVVALGIAISYRTERSYLVVLLWLGIILLAGTVQAWLRS
jgi:hypothetical protein